MTRSNEIHGWPTTRRKWLWPRSFDRVFDSFDKAIVSHFSGTADERIHCLSVGSIEWNLLEFESCSCNSPRCLLLNPWKRFFVSVEHHGGFSSGQCNKSVGTWGAKEHRAISSTCGQKTVRSSHFSFDRSSSDLFQMDDQFGPSQRSLR